MKAKSETVKWKSGEMRRQNDGKSTREDGGREG